MKKQIKQVREFHIATESVVNEEIKLKLRELLLRTNLISEEAAEVHQAFDKLIHLITKRQSIKFNKPVLINPEERQRILALEDKEILCELLKELTDLLYVIYGTFVSLGISSELAEAIFDEVHRSNMSKTVDGKVVKNEQGKVLKPESYTPADILSILSTLKS